MKVFFWKIFFLTTLFSASSQAVLSVPANPRPQKMQQANGFTVTIVVQGDEHGHLTMTTDGYPLFYNDTTGNYEYAVMSDGQLVGSGVVAADADSRSAEVADFLNGLDTDGVKMAMTAKRSDRVRLRRSGRNAPQRVRLSDIPSSGEQRSLVILVNFSDCAFTTVDDPQAFYTRMLNEEGFTYSNGANGSARDYYIASSFGQYYPTFDVAGPVTLSQSYAYYGANDSEGYEYNSRLASMVEEACTLVDDEVDFSQYDSNNDGVVDNIFFFYAGYGEADSYKKNTIWPHSAYYMDDFGGRLALDGKYINSYACTNEINANNEQTAGIGTFVHEYGHVLGLPDLYDVNYSSATFTPGYFDLMDGGEYNNNGHTPPLFSAWERGEMGWLDFIELSSAADTTMLSLLELSNSNMAYRVSVDGTDGNEYYVLENRQKKGWDAYLPGHGMLMWHIDYDKTAWKNNTVNTDGEHQRVDLVEADGKQSKYSTGGDTFPGSSDVTQWTMKSWSGDVLLSVDDIKEENDTITFTASWPSLGVNNVPHDVSASEIVTVYDLNGLRYHSLDCLPHGLYVVKKGDKAIKIVK